MKSRMALVALVVALAIIFSVVSTAIAESSENTEQNGTIFRNSRDTDNGGDPGAEPCGGGDEVGGPNPK